VFLLASKTACKFNSRNVQVQYQIAVGCYVSGNCSFRRACNSLSVKLTVGWEASHHRIRDLRGKNYARRLVFFPPEVPSIK
jgi:hypothetical protein